jgi:peptidoglycan/LPS O-acetylase OafA/YrhL
MDRHLSEQHDVNRTAERVPQGRLSYTPALDGMRAFAILAVLGTHYIWNGKPLLRAGYLGVDMFFVLSGFLITTLLLAEHDRAGRISLRDFYARRALRLLPLLAVVLVVAMLVLMVTHPGSPGRPSWPVIGSTAFYIANWSHIWHSGHEGFLSPAWSLAIEEQFYLVWPLVVMGLLALGFGRRTLAALAVAGAAAAVFWRHHILTSPPRPATFAQYYSWFTFRHPTLAVDVHATRFNRVYFGTDTRADMLLVGCALAIVLGFVAVRLTARTRAGIHVVGALAAVVVVLFLVDVISTSGNWIENWGAVAFELCVAAVIAAVMINSAGLLARFLGWRPFVWIGRRSYGIYLVHLFVFQVIHKHLKWLGGYGSLVVEMMLVFLIAAISFRFLETPALRLKQRFTGARPESLASVE